MDPHTTNLKAYLIRRNVSTGTVSNRASFTRYLDELSQTSVEGDHHGPNRYDVAYNHMLVLKSSAVCAKAYNGYGTHLYDYLGPTQYCNSKYFDWISSKDEVYNSMLGKLVEKARGGLDMSVDIAESRQTRTMLKELGTVQRYLSGIGVKRWANEWLQLQYGWLPLMSSLYGITEEMIRYADSSCIIRSGARKETPLDGRKLIGTNPDLSGAGDYCLGNLFSDHIGLTTYFCHCKIRMRPYDWLESLSRWTSLNPLSIMWELTPYSFVADWFVDVGGFLRNLESSYLFGNAFRDGYLTEGWAGEASEVIELVPSSWSGPLSSSKILQYQQAKDYVAGSMSRRLLLSFPGPRLPTIKFDLSWRRWLSAGALLRQRFA